MKKTITTPKHKKPAMFKPEQEAPPQAPRTKKLTREEVLELRRAQLKKEG